MHCMKIMLLVECIIFQKKLVQKITNSSTWKHRISRIRYIRNMNYYI